MRSPDPEMQLNDFRPRSKLEVPVTDVPRPRFGVIDAHNHLGRTYGGGWIDKPTERLIDIMDEAGIDIVVDLDGGWGESILYAHIDHFQSVHPDRFRHFGGIDWTAWPNHGNGFGEWAAGRLRVQARQGASGLKIWKQFGLNVLDGDGNRARVDDPTLDPIWSTAADLGLPIVIHVADPVAFFDPLGENNERWEELIAHPDWHFPSPPYPSFRVIVEALANVVARHPSTTFIGAHVGCYAENLAWVSALLDRCPNFHVDIAARIAELGRQPTTAKRFFTDHADRILFGTDSPPDLPNYRLHYRFLETADEYFDYDVDGRGEQGRWKIYGLDLPNEVLKSVYHDNAQRILTMASPATDSPLL